jgi:hypothetical protein
MTEGPGVLSMALNSVTYLQRLRLWHLGGNGSATCLAVERLLNNIDLRPPGMLPSAVLVVRRMSDPQPGRLAPRLGAVRVHTAWEQAARQQLADLQRRAARPALGPALGDAEAVLFADESELLACLARDLGRGQAGQRWWWRALLRATWGGNGFSGNEAYLNVLLKRLVQQPRLTPSVLAHLQTWGETAVALSILTPDQASQALRAVLQAFNSPDPPNAAPIAARPPPPWAENELIAPGLPANLGREREALWGVGLDLYARPQIATSAAYQRQFHAWWRAAGQPGFRQTAWPDAGAVDNAVARPAATTGGASNVSGVPHALKVAGTMAETADSPTIPSPPAAFPDKSAAPADYLDSSDSLEPARQVESVGQVGNNQPARAAAKAISVAESDVAGVADKANDSPAAVSGLTGFIQPAIPAREAADNAPHRWPDSAVDVQWPGDTAVPAHLKTPAVTVAPSPLLLADGVTTRLGGILYLINLMTALDLPDCFETGWRLASGVGSWGLLHALGWELLAQEQAVIADDPLWLALAHLDGRKPDEAPGIRLPGSRPRRRPPFKLPAAWLEDIPIAGAQPAAGLHGSYRPLLARWLALALPFIELRLRLALDLPSDASLATGMLLLPGDLYITATHVDLVASLEHISLRVRLAGLDRDPGWLPEFGRVVTFHYE